MIVDGVEVLYTMRNGKIADPNIPLDGLVCYLDTRGKYNTDVYRNTLLDLSGNGNHGTLQNFNFTEGSGYVDDLPGGTSGLRFDGVDDLMLGGPSNNLSTPAFTYMIEFTINKTAKEQNALIGLGMGFYVHSANNNIYCILTNNASGNTYSPVNIAVGKHKVIIAYTKDFTDVEYFVDGIRSTAINTTDAQGLPYTHKGVGGAFRVNEKGEKIISKQAIWDRRLSELEIQQLMEV